MLQTLHNPAHRRSERCAVLFVTAPAMASAPEWRALHSHVVDAILGQQPENIEALLYLFGGLRMRDFTTALDTGFARIRSVIENDTLKYMVEVQSDYGWAVLTRPPAVALGMEDTEELRDAEVSFHAERMLRELGVDVAGEPE